MSIGLTAAGVSELFGSSNNSSSGILGALYGSAAPSGDPIAALASAETNETKDVAATAAQPTVQRDIAAFTKAVQGATSVSSLLANPTVLKVLLAANGLSGQEQYPALAQKALTSDPSNTSSLANQLSSTNSAWLSTAKTYQFATQGLAVIRQPSVISTITNAYAEFTWRQGLDQTTPGLSNALTFRAEAGSITSALQILGDPVMRDVVTTALGLPLQIALQPIDTQEQAITSRMDVTQFKSVSFTDQFVKRYLLAKASSSGNTTSGSSLVV